MYGMQTSTHTPLDTVSELSDGLCCWGHVQKCANFVRERTDRWRKRESKENIIYSPLSHVHDCLSHVVHVVATQVGCRDG